MTNAYKSLQDGPKTGLSRGQFAPDERAEVRVLKVDSSHGRSSTGEYVGSFTSIYYLEGDESAAARRFVEVNNESLDRIDFSTSNVLDSNLSQELYDLVLHHAGERVREVRSTVVRENRSDGVTWVMDREYYETTGRGRYSIGSSKVAKAPSGVSLEDVFRKTLAGEPIQPPTLEEAGIKGGVRQVLDYYRVAPEFPCTPTTVNGELAVIPEKSLSQS